MVLNAVRIRAICCSSTTASKRFHNTSSTIESSALGLTAIVVPHHHVALSVDLAVCPAADDQGRFALLDNCRSAERGPNAQRITVVDGGVNPTAAFGEVGRAPSSKCLARVATRRRCERQMQRRL